jgi:hypothetical protein
MKIKKKSKKFTRVSSFQFAAPTCASICSRRLRNCKTSK